jgi:hypothetical protein
MLATLSVLGSTNVGLCAGIFARLAGGQPLYSATATGFGFGITALIATITVLTFARSD